MLCMPETQVQFLGDLASTSRTNFLPSKTTTKLGANLYPYQVMYFSFCLFVYAFVLGLNLVMLRDYS